MNKKQVWALHSIKIAFTEPNSTNNANTRIENAGSEHFSKGIQISTINQRI